MHIMGDTIQPILLAHKSTFIGKSPIHQFKYLLHLFNRSSVSEYYVPLFIPFSTAIKKC